MDVDPLADERLTVMGLLTEAFSAIAARATQQVAGHGLTRPEFEVLLRVGRSPSELLRMSDLAAQTSVTTSGITRVVDRLEAKGLVSRQACPTDRRMTYCVITDAGRDLLAEVLPGHVEVVETWLTGPLAESGDLEGFAAAVRRLRDRVAPCSTAGADGG